MPSVLLGNLLEELILGNIDITACADRSINWGKVAHVRPFKVFQVAVVGRRSDSALLRILCVRDCFAQLLESGILITFSPVKISMAILGSQGLVHVVGAHVFMNESNGGNEERRHHQSVTNATEFPAVVGNNAGAVKLDVLERDLVDLSILSERSSLSLDNPFGIIDHVNSNATSGPAQARIPKHENLKSEENS